MLPEAFSRVTYAGSSSGTNWVWRVMGPGVGRGVGCARGTISVAAGVGVDWGVDVFGAGDSVGVGFVAG